MQYPSLNAFCPSGTEGQGTPTPAATCSTASGATDAAADAAVYAAAPAGMEHCLARTLVQ